MTKLNWLHRICALAYKALHRKKQSKYHSEKVFSRNDMVYICQIISKKVIDGNCTDDFILFYTSLILLVFNGLDKTISDNILMHSCLATHLGWLHADKILSNMAEHGGAWSEDFFDTHYTSAYLSIMHTEYKITDREELTLLRWFYRQGERLRVKYHNIPEFIDAFEKGQLYDIEVLIYER